MIGRRPENQLTFTLDPRVSPSRPRNRMPLRSLETERANRGAQSYHLQEAPRGLAMEFSPLFT
jgi:hypothetical protein